VSADPGIVTTVRSSARPDSPVAASIGRGGRRVPEFDWRPCASTFWNVDTGAGVLQTLRPPLPS
jgi:hypothetical protein